MKRYLVAPVLLLALGWRAEAQAPPVATPPTFGFFLPTVEGTLTYSLSASESFLIGYNDGVNYLTAVSGSLGYLSSSPNKPFSLVYSGGYLYSSVPGYPGSSTFQNLAASQVVTTKNWNFVIDDAVSYLPESPTTGLSGIPGVGDIGVDPVQIGDQPTQSILTNYATRVGNGLNGGFTRKFGGSLSINGSASWQILHFTGDEGIDSSMVSASLGPTYRIDARSSASANVVYTYTDDTYAGYSYPFETEGVDFQYQRQLTRFFNMSVMAGPQRTFGTGAAASLIPSQDNRDRECGPDLRPQKHQCQCLLLSRHERWLRRRIWSAHELGRGQCSTAVQPQLAGSADRLVLAEHFIGKNRRNWRGLSLNLRRRPDIAEA